MKNLTKKKAIELHREMWRRISEMSDEEFEELRYDEINIEKEISKRVIKNSQFPIKRLFNDSFCCDYNRRHLKTCDACPIKFTNDRCWGVGSEHDDFIISLENKNLNKAREIAKQISELPERK